MSRARIAGHSLHPMLIVFPLGLLVTSMVWDIVHLASGREPMWAQIAFWSIVAGLIGGTLAAIPGLIDWLAIPKGTRARQIGLYHMVLNLVVVALFLLSAILRAANDPGGYATPTVGQMLLGWSGIGIATVSGWLGAELVERLGIGVYRDANPNAPSSLRPHERTPVHR